MEEWLDKKCPVETPLGVPGSGDVRHDPASPPFEADPISLSPRANEASVKLMYDDGGVMLLLTVYNGCPAGRADDFRHAFGDLVTDLAARVSGGDDGNDDTKGGAA